MNWVIYIKVIFLDFDGVINDIHFQDVLVNPLFVMELKKLTNITGAKIVVTSNRRNDFLSDNLFLLEQSFCYKQIIKPLLQLGIKIYDYTPFIEAKKEETRELEIEAYLREHPEIEEFVIIEDDYVMQRLYDHQVFIEYSDGFVSKYVEPAAKILNGDLGFYPSEYDRCETFQERIERLFPSLCSKQTLEKSKDLEKILDIFNNIDSLELSMHQDLVKKLKINK